MRQRGQGIWGVTWGGSVDSTRTVESEGDGGAGISFRVRSSCLRQEGLQIP